MVTWDGGHHIAYTDDGHVAMTGEPKSTGCSRRGRDAQKIAAGRSYIAANWSGYFRAEHEERGDDQLCR